MVIEAGRKKRHWTQRKTEVIKEVGVENFE